MTTEHDALHDLLAPVALGAADPTETARVEAHARRCQICSEELAELRAATAVLALDVPRHAPSPGLRASLMDTVRAEAAEREVEAAAQAPSASPRPRPVRRSWREWLRPGPAIAVACALVVLLIGVTIVLRDAGTPAPQVATVAISGTSDAPGVTGRVVYLADEDTAIVNLSRLPPLQAGEAYQLWVLRNGRATSAGLFEQTAATEARRVVTGIAGADALAVTAQPRSNRTSPEGPILVSSPLPA